MCLQTDDPTIHIASENMICYKTGNFEDGGDYFKPSSFHYRYQKDKITPKVTLNPSKNGTDAWNSDRQYIVEEGYHSFVSKIDCGMHRDAAIFVIPKGTEYIKGQFNHDRHIENYVSSRIIYLGPLNKKTHRKFLWKYQNPTTALIQEMKLALSSLLDRIRK